MEKNNNAHSSKRRGNREKGPNNKSEKTADQKDHWPPNSKQDVHESKRKRKILEEEEKTKIAREGRDEDQNEEQNVRKFQKWIFQKEKILSFKLSPILTLNN